jgi:hypothetical protein
MDDVNLASLKARWNDVLDDLESTHRTAWLALFDARLASLEGQVLTLDFTDATKLAGVHGFERASRPEFLSSLVDSIERVLGRRLGVHISPEPDREQG